VSRNPFRAESNNIRDQRNNHGGGYRAYAPALAALNEVKAPPVAGHGRPFDVWRDQAPDQKWAVGRIEHPGCLFVVWRTNSKRDARRLMEHLNTEWETNGPFAIVNKGNL
jgi:hypothetical protein